MPWPLSLTCLSCPLSGSTPTVSKKIKRLDHFNIALLASQWTINLVIINFYLARAIWPMEWLSPGYEQIRSGWVVTIENWSKIYHKLKFLKLISVHCYFCSYWIILRLYITVIHGSHIWSFEFRMDLQYCIEHESFNLKPRSEMMNHIVTSSVIGWAHIQNDPC